MAPRGVAGAAPGQNADQSSYDLILVVEYFRTMTAFVSIIKHLSGQYRIGLFQVTIDPHQLSKQPAAQEQFVRLCVESGAEVVPSGPVYTKVLLVPQRPYRAESLRAIRDNIRAKRTLGALAFAWAGEAMHDAFLTECSVDKVLMIDRRLIAFLLDHRGRRDAYATLELAEVGLPYRQYPIFPDFAADYLLAIPTPFSFPHERDKWDFLETVLSLFGEIDPRDTVVHKPHNGMDHDQFSTITYRRVARFFGWIPGVATVLRWFGTNAPKTIRAHFGKLYTAHVYEKVLARTVSLADHTDSHDLALEAFLPGVRKGVIGGLSNTIWGALHARLPFYNCVDITRQRPEEGDRLYGEKRPARALGLNFEFFEVPFCGGKLTFDSKYFNVVADSSRQGDLIAEIENEIATVPNAH